MDNEFETFTKRRRFRRWCYISDKFLGYSVGFLCIFGLVCMFKATEDSYCYREWNKLMAYRASIDREIDTMVERELRKNPREFRDTMYNTSRQNHTIASENDESSVIKQERSNDNVNTDAYKGNNTRKENAKVNITHGNDTGKIMNQTSAIPRLDKATKEQYNFVIDTTNLESLFSKDVQVKRVSCRSLFDDDRNAILDTAVQDSKTKRVGISSSQYYQMSQNCTNFIHERGYITFPVTDIERDFPLAFSLIYYRDLEQMERLLRAIYRPQNTYCIHVDVKTLSEDKIAVRAITSCFPNVFIASKSVDIHWGAYSVLEAELVCMRDLWAYPNWRYFINLTGQEFPLKTNLELVQILRAMQWANIVDGTWIRARANYFSRWLKSGKGPPHNIRPIKGSLHVVINRDFVNFALNDYRSKAFLVWLNKTEIPDESFFSSLNHNPHLRIPGSFLGDPEEYPLKPSFTRYKNWDIGHGVWTRKCSGKFVRNVCVLGMGDLHRLKDDIGLFVNKFHLDFEHYAFDCLEELMYNRTRNQYLNRQFIDVSFYSKLDQVKLRYVKQRDNSKNKLSRWLI